MGAWAGVRYGGRAHGWVVGRASFLGALATCTWV